MKNGKELKLDVYENYKIVSGTVDNKNPKSIYINISTWGQPKRNDSQTINYDRVINNIHKAVKNNVTTNINCNNFHKDKIIVDLDMRKSGVGYGKRSFMNCEITLFQHTQFKINSDEMQNEVKKISKLIVEMFDTNEYFTFHKKKR